MDRDLQLHADPWAFLAALSKTVPADIEPTILRATGDSHTLDVSFTDSEDQAG